MSDVYTPKPTLRKGKSHKALTLLETILALSIGAIVIVSSFGAFTQYSQNLQTQATAAQLQRLADATERWLSDNFQCLTLGTNCAPGITQAPGTYNINVVLAPYLGANVGNDPFGHQYALSIRRVNFQTTDPTNPTGPLRNRVGVQAAIVAQGNFPTAIDERPGLAVDIVNSMGERGFYVAGAAASGQFPGSSNALGCGVPGLALCGSFGTFSIAVNGLPAAQQFPAAAFTTARYGALVTRTDSSFYGDQLYRFFFGDEDLNTMRTTLFMDNNDIDNVNDILGTRVMQMRNNINVATLAPGQAANSAANITNPTGGLFLTAQGATGTVVVQGSQDIVLNSDRDIRLATGTNNIILRGSSDTATPIIEANNTITVGANTFSQMQLGRNADRVIVGTPRIIPNINITLGEGNVRARTFFGEEVRAKEINSVSGTATNALRLQRYARGEVIIGHRARYRPRNLDGTLGGIYEISDGTLVAGHIRAQDITCADCGGTLSQVLPRWRHMNTFLVNDGDVVTMPFCGQNARRDLTNRAAVPPGNLFGEDAFTETAEPDRGRFTPRIILVPREIRVFPDFVQTGFTTAPPTVLPWSLDFSATADASSWTINIRDRAGGNRAAGRALAMTYCQFNTTGWNVFSPTAAPNLAVPHTTPGQFIHTPRP